MANQKILVTGANGQLGRELQQIAPRYQQYEFIFLSKDELSIDDFELVRRALRTRHPSYCINAAAYTSVDKAESEKELAFLINGKAPGVLASACSEIGCRFLHISTDYVFDGMATTPYKEDSPTNPQNVYGESKLEGERQAMHFDPGSIVIRTSWVYSQYGKNFVKTMLKLMSERDKISVVNDQVGSPTYAWDLAEAIVKIVGQIQPHGAPGGLYHFTNDGIISWYDFALAISELSGCSCRVDPIPTSEFPTPAMRPAYSALDKSKIQQVFGITLNNWKHSLASCIQRLSV